MNKTYTIELNGIILGTSMLEKADPSMGVVFGEIIIRNSQIDYLFLKSFCENNGIELASDYPEGKLISTTTIDSLKVTNSEGIAIEGGWKSNIWNG
ncbi:hypothetical protein [Spongiivirga citrea]|uniref:Uncharacterized protein n=1 Tax=Spongiivirga citrea TaxID=1481457 RepID=A0A6M0CJ64_9FLAO|nr:hypothetical protein [Spongiivirga citrea]NER17612.1 hypothetical protein [Spongiivirga citrea]